MALILTTHQHSKHTVICPEFNSDDSSYHFEWVTKNHPDRESLQTFIATTFYKTYGADVHHFSDILVGCKDERGQWLAALGFSSIRQKKVFLEQYLDIPLEMEIAAHTHENTSRSEIVEVGNLAAIHAGAGRTLIINMTRYLHEQGYKWVAFTATRNLLNSFKRLGIKLVQLAEADPKRLPDAGKNWGSYYDTKPQVMFGDIASGYAKLA
ncbi:MAG: hypothetical protein RJB21_359 [Pseudomonadota bacterium]|jgi:hypothetical protein